MAFVSAAAALGASVLGAVGIGAGTVAASVGGLFFAQAAVGFLAQAALGLALNALTPKPSRPDRVERGYSVNSRGSALDHQIIYGKAKVGAAIVFDGTTGTNNKFLHRVLAFSGHEIESFDEIYINDAKVTNLEADGNVKEIELPDGTTSNRYDGFIRINKHLGTDNQAADSDLVSEVTDWTTAHRLRGIAYMYCRFKFDSDKFPNGLPTVTATIKGKKVYDPRSDTTAWSDNPALCLRDYLTNGYGLNEDSSNIDDALVSTAANVCDETNTVAGDTRYTCNGAFTTGQTPYDTINNMITSMGGLVWYAQGKWRMKPAYWVAPTTTFTEDDLRSSIAVKTRHSRRDNFNTVRGTFRGEETNWQTTDYPEVTNSAFLSADNGQESVADIDLPFTDSSTEARRIARIALERNRQQLTVSASFGLRAFQVQVGDVVKLSVDRFGWAQKEFEVVSWTFGLTDDLDLQVQMGLREISESVFDEVDDGVVYERDNTTLDDPFTVQTPALDVASVSTTVNNDGTTIPQIKFTWSVTDESVVDYYLFQWKLTAESTYNSQTVDGNEFVLDPAISGASYNYRVAAVNHLGVKSQFINAASPISTGDDGTTPNPPSNVTASGGYAIATVTWDPPTQNTDGSALKDLFQYRIYRGTSSNPTTLIGRVSGEAFTESGLANNQQYYYRIKALDFTGNESAYSANASVTTNPELQDGADGERGPGRWNIAVASVPTTSSGAHTDFTNAIGSPVNLDQAWFYTGTQSNPTSQSVWIYNEGSGATAADSWNEQEEVIDGDLLVAGTVTSDRLVSQTISTLGLNIGTLKSNPSGERIEISDDKIVVFDSSGNIRVQIGNLTT